jgi:hypothetical protein
MTQYGSKYSHGNHQYTTYNASDSLADQGDQTATSTGSKYTLNITVVRLQQNILCGSDIRKNMSEQNDTGRQEKLYIRQILIYWALGRNAQIGARQSENS